VELFSETDLELVDALQLNPRASWEKVGAALGLSAVTVARRWAALTAKRLAWTGSVLGPALFRGAFIEVRCHAGTVDSVAETLSQLPDVITVARTAGEYDLYAITVAATTDALTASLFGPIAELDVARTTSHVYWRVYGGPQWRLSVLNPVQSSGLATGKVRAERPPVVSAADRELLLALAGDARRSHTELADELDSTPQTVRRQLLRMERAGVMSFRADLARPAAGWPLLALLWLAVPDAELDSVGRDLGSWTETRFCAAVAATATLVLVLNLRTPEHLAGLAARIRRQHPSADIVDRRLVLRMLKLNGRMLDSDGRSRRLVPVDPWVWDR
jgi:DNA-binding Lrp family transcriptional regulator